MQSWKRIEPTEVHTVGHRVIVTKRFVMPDGNIETFDIVGAEGSQYVNAIALTPERQVVIARMFRTGPETIMDELPGGEIKENEKPADAALRELLEETGYKGGDVLDLGTSHKDAYMNAAWHSFLITDCRLVSAQKLDAEEHIEVRLISIDALIENAKNDHMTDVLPVFLAQDKLNQLKAGK